MADLVNIAVHLFSPYMILEKCDIENYILLHLLYIWKMILVCKSRRLVERILWAKFEIGAKNFGNLFAYL